METVDVGGASAGGRPPMPPMQTVDESGTKLSGEPKYPGSRNTQRSTPEVPESVKKATQGTSDRPPTRAIYPETHPANYADITSDGGITINGRGTNKTEMYKPLGDVSQGYVTGQRGEDQNAAPPPPDLSKVPVSLGGTLNVGVDEAMAEIDREIALATSTAASTLAGAFEKIPAHDADDKPLIEVVFHTEIGAIVSYHTQVSEQGKYLILVDDNRQSAQQKFIPTPQRDKKVSPLAVSITGKDGIVQQRMVVPLGINFTLSSYDFFIMLVVTEEELAAMAAREE